MDTPRDLLGGHPVAAELAPEEIEALAAATEFQEFAAGEEIAAGTAFATSV
jgi:hypothetical protein